MTPEHKALDMPSVRAKDVVFVVILAVAVYVIPARMDITREKYTLNVLTLEVVA